MRRALMLTVMVVAGGCTTPAADPPSPPGTLPLTFPWELLDCRFFNVDLAVPAERLAARLPEGFEIDANPSPLAPVEGGAPYLGLEAFSCADGSGWASFYTSVIAPEHLTLADHLHFVMWDTLYANETTREALAARGFPVRAGTVAISAGPGTQAIRADVEIEDLGALSFQGIVAQEGTPFEGDFVEYMDAEDGTLAAWRTHYAAQTLSTGRAVVTLPSGSWLADLVGSDRAQGSFITGMWSFTGGNVTVQPL